VLGYLYQAVWGACNNPLSSEYGSIPMVRRLICPFVLGLLLSACVSGPTVQEIQATECNNSDFSVEWNCIKSRMATNPRHQGGGAMKRAVMQIYLYGDKLEEAVATGGMVDAQASMALLEFVNQLDAAHLRRLRRSMMIRCRTIGGIIHCY